MICSVYQRVHIITKISDIVSTRLLIHAHKWSFGSSPYRPAACTACGSPPRTSAAPPPRCEPQWRRRVSRGCRGCRGCRCRGAAPQTREAAGGRRPLILGSEAPTQHAHLKMGGGRKIEYFWSWAYLLQIRSCGLICKKGIRGLILSVYPFVAFKSQVCDISVL